MSDKTRIEWADATINPLGWGCVGPTGTAEHPVLCPYCYAKRLAARNLRACPKCRAFMSHADHWGDEIAKLLSWRKPRRIFIQSCGDLFGPVPADWGANAHPVAAMQAWARQLPRHTFIFLTKRGEALPQYNPWPDNCWVGVTATDQASWESAINGLYEVNARVKFVSIEPLLSAVNPIGISWVQWIIIGAQTGPGTRMPDALWVLDLMHSAEDVGVPIFLKDNLHLVAKRQEFPR